jgi:hypothetical protein
MMLSIFKQCLSVDFSFLRYHFRKKIKFLTLSVFCFFTNSYVLAYDPVDCLKDITKADITIPVGLATKLCSASYSSEPVLCYVGVGSIDSGINRGISIDLCAGSTDSAKTLSCYQRASELKLNRALATTLCGAKKQEK